ncbi:MAG: anthranilate phosphoribosyltransferase [Magnetococcales bacterium]|nr:anthranilate phosphoribosyltransferase [Magnetococcales bacterium]MBF0151774.1 anthranilate phosphoribosyltransferase [Magnetococcales bacterium]MBF0632403.1 anthranilate phosphoribosyltransferase [Magnetococcales bacterium]
MNLVAAITKLLDHQDLSQEEARSVMERIMTGEATPAQIAAYVIALRMKGETVDELAGSAQAMRDQAVKVVVAGAPLIDTCGTGGDGRGTFNISTTAAFVVAACGVTVAKHGNRSISSKCGSADLLKALGVKIEVTPDVVARCLSEAGIGFLFAPSHHGAMKHAAQPRKELGVRTIFNLLGPLTNPASATCQLMGVFDGRWTEPLARVLGRLGLRRAMVVHGMDGLDEITTTTSSRISELKTDGTVMTWQVEPEQWGMTRAAPADLAGGDAEENAAITRAILSGAMGPGRDIVLVNAGAALYVADVVADVVTGIRRAARAIDLGEAKNRLDHLIALTYQS